MYDPTWLFRGAQSALFYYVSCAPCSKITSTRKRRKQIERDRRAREAREAHSPELYRQPSPYRTNQYWDEEINLGPGPPLKRASKKQRNARAKLIENGAPESQPTGMDDATKETGALEAVKQKIHDAGERWTNKRYQREDEELWGSNQGSWKSSHVGASKQDHISGSSTGFPGYPGQSEIGRSSKETFYTAKNPPLNDLHPPVVSNPSPNWHSNRWMLQPPPSASVMAGYENARSRSNSGTSSRKGGEIPLNKQVGEKMIEKKLQNGELVSSVRTPHKARLADAEGQNHQRNTSPRPKPSFNGTGEQNSEDSSETNNTVIHRLQTSAHKSPGSADSGIGDIEYFPTDLNLDFVMPRSPPRALLKRPTVFTKDSSLHVLQELVSPNSLAFSKFVSDPSKEAMVRLPPSDSQDELELINHGNDNDNTLLPAWEDDYRRWNIPSTKTRWSC